MWSQLLDLGREVKYPNYYTSLWGQIIGPFPLLKCCFVSFWGHPVRSRIEVTIHLKVSFMRQKLYKIVCITFKNMSFKEEMAFDPSDLVWYPLSCWPKYVWNWPKRVFSPSKCPNIIKTPRKRMKYHRRRTNSNITMGHSDRAPLVKIGHLGCFQVKKRAKCVQRRREER